MSDTLIDRIYESAAIPELWEDTLQRVAEETGCLGGLLFVLRDARTRWVASPGVLALWEGFVAGGWLENNSRANRLLAFNHAGWVHDLDLFTPEELEREPVYIEFFRKIGAGWGAGTAMELPDGDSIFFTMERAYAAGPFPHKHIAALDALRPHLGRAAYLSMRLAMAHAQATTAALSAVGTAAAVVRPNGRLLAANTQMEALIPEVFADRRERLTLTSKTADDLLGRALMQLSEPGSVADVASIPVRGRVGEPGLVIHVLPVRRAASDVFSGAAFIVIANTVGIAASPRASLLSALFDLTPAEARVARAMADLKTPEAIAAENGVSRETVKTQMKAIYTKTGVHSQTAMVRLLTAVGKAASI
ncbi:helix-turn-helix transcriptional regulator [Aquabacter sp. CN5-332]|uniref:helix-turn-helix transcriptional regulator n=1 Tax=Aquabacter sp. CN5-332 TaxID=3156608 RepID=UPI0032B4042C